MGSFSIWHWLIVASVLANAFFLGRILWRMGFSPLWLLVSWVPLFNTIGFWLVASKPWPKAAERQ